MTKIYFAKQCTGQFNLVSNSTGIGLELWNCKSCQKFLVHREKNIEKTSFYISWEHSLINSKVNQSTVISSSCAVANLTFSIAKQNDLVSFSDTLMNFRDSELFEIEKDSGMESIVSSKDETPERKTVRADGIFQ